MTLTISEIVDISSRITESGAARRDFGINLFMTKDTTLGTGSNRIVVLPDTDTGDETFSAGSEPKSAYDIYFQQSPYPKNMIVGRWIFADVGAQLLGGDHALLAVLAAIGDASLAMNGEDYTGIVLTGAVSLAAVATLIQAKFAAGTDVNLKTATVSYEATEAAFKVTCATTGATSTLTVASTVAPASGTDIAALIGWDVDSVATKDLNQGADEETISEAIAACIALNDSPYFIDHDETIIDFATINEINTWVSTRNYMYSMSSLEAGALTPSESATVAAQIFALEPPRTFCTWSGTSDYKAVSAAGRLSGINFAGRNTLITMNLKRLPGTLADTLTPTGKAELDRKFMNYYTPLQSAGSPESDSYMTGTTFKSGTWIDVRYFLDWQTNAIQVDVFNLLYATDRAYQTNPGQAAIQRVVEKAVKQGVRNGGIAPGQLSDVNIEDVRNTTGNLDFDGYLPTGYLIYSAPVEEQAQADRAARKAQPFKVWVKGSGAIHFVEISLIFEN